MDGSSDRPPGFTVSRRFPGCKNFVAGRTHTSGAPKTTIGSKKWTKFKTTLLAIQDDLKGRPWDLSDIRVQPSADELDAALG